MLYRRHIGMHPDLFDRLTDHTWDLPLWVGLAARFKGPIVELGCGTGRVLQHLHANGHAATGVEIDPRLAQVAAERVGQDSVRLGDAREVHCAPASLVIVPNNTLSMPPDPIPFLRGARGHLRKQGVLVFDLVVPEGRTWAKGQHRWHRRNAGLLQGGRFNPKTRRHRGWAHHLTRKTVIDTWYPPLHQWASHLQRAGLSLRTMLDARGGAVRSDTSTVIVMATLASQG